MLSRLPYALAVFATCLLVALLLTLCDRFSHVQFGVLAYANPAWTGQAWWALANFFAAASGMYLGAKFSLVRYVSTPTLGALAFSVAWFVAAYFATGIFAGHPQALLTGLLLAWGLRLLASKDRLVTLLFSLLLAVLGCAIEGAETLTGAFAYRDPEIFHVPYWLAGLYMNGSFVVLQIVRLVETRYGKVG